MVIEHKALTNISITGVISDMVLLEKITELLALHGIENVTLVGALRSFADKIKDYKASERPVIIFQGLDQATQNEMATICNFHFDEDLPKIAITEAHESSETVPAQADSVSVLPQPFRPGSLLDLLAYCAKRSQTSHAKKSYKIAHFTFAPALLTLTPKKGEPIKLTEKERDVLLLLLNTENHTIPREDLLEIVWGYRSDTETHTAETHIYRLRQKIEKDPSNPQIVLTVHEGYELKV